MVLLSPGASPQALLAAMVVKAFCLVICLLLCQVAVKHPCGLTFKALVDGPGGGCHWFWWWWLLTALENAAERPEGLWAVINL